MASADERQQVKAEELCRGKHVKFFKRCLQVLPGRYASLDTSRMTVAYFAVSGLDLLDALDELSANERAALVEWIYRLQVVPPATNANANPPGDEAVACTDPQCIVTPSDGIAFAGGFKGSPCCAGAASHLAMTYTALAVLAILGDDLRRVNRVAALEGVRRLQMPDGSYRSTADGGEDDMRFVYCAAWICHALGDWSGMDVDRAVAFIESALTYEGAFAQKPFAEAHGGSTFCALAALSLMGRLDQVLSGGRRDMVVRWCCMRQVGSINSDPDRGGYQGRPNKQADTCYSFWIGASLCILDAYACTVDWTANRAYLMTAQDKLVGGFAKWPGLSPDALHAYMGLAGLSLMAEPGLSPVDPALNMSKRAAAHLRAMLPSGTASTTVNAASNAASCPNSADRSHSLAYSVCS